MLYNGIPRSPNTSVTEAATSQRTWSLEQRTFQSQPTGLPASWNCPTEDYTSSHDWNTNCFNISIRVLISCHTRLSMPRRDSEEENAAPLQPAFTTPTKSIRNDGAGHDMQSRMPKEPKMNLMPMLRKNSTSRRARSATTLVTTRINLSRSGPLNHIPCWRMPKLNMKSIPRWRNICMWAAWRKLPDTKLKKGVRYSFLEVVLKRI